MVDLGRALMGRAKVVVLLSAVLMIIAAALGCGDSGTKSMCDKAAECNALSGMSVAECAEKAEKAMNELTSAVRHDIEVAIEECNKYSSCEMFLKCVPNFFGSGSYGSYGGSY